MTATEQVTIDKSLYLKLVAAALRDSIGDGHQVMKYVDVATSFSGTSFDVTMEHDPTFKMTFNGAEGRATELSHWRWVLKHVPDYHHEDADVWVEGDAVRLNETMVGTFPGGKVNRSVVKMTFWFGDDGKVNRQHVNYKPEENVITQQLIAQMPAGWSGDMVL